MSNKQRTRQEDEGHNIPFGTDKEHYSLNKQDCIRTYDIHMKTGHNYLDYLMR